jgi:23S rRNA (uracil1939-C5)-methyltransferase
MLDQGAEVVLAGMAEGGLKSAMALQDFAAENQLARLVVDQGDGAETLWEPEPATVRFGAFTVSPPPHAFLQATSEGEAALIAAVREAVGDAPVVADLFAGIGTFALSLANGRKLYAAEAARDAILALKSASDRAQAGVVTEHRDLFRRPLTPAELNRFGAVVLDPPRAGAEEQVKALAESAVPQIAYVSCNPASFARDAAVLINGGYALRWVQPVGQFRWSTHVELAANFTRGQ